MSIRTNLTAVAAAIALSMTPKMANAMDDQELIESFYQIGLIEQVTNNCFVEIPVRQQMDSAYNWQMQLLTSLGGKDWHLEAARDYVKEQFEDLVKRESMDTACDRSLLALRDGLIRECKGWIFCIGIY